MDKPLNIGFEISQTQRENSNEVDSHQPNQQEMEMYMKDFMGIYDQQHGSSVEMIKKVNDILEGITEKRINTIQGLGLQTISLNINDKFLDINPNQFLLDNNPIIPTTTSNITDIINNLQHQHQHQNQHHYQDDDNENDKKSYIESLLLKLRKRKMKIKHLKESIREYTQQKFHELETKIIAVESNHINQGKEISLVKDKVRDRSSTKLEKFFSLNNSLRMKSPLNIGRSDDIKEISDFNLRINDKGLDDLFNRDIAKDVFLEENDRLKKEQNVLKIFIEYMFDFSEKYIDELCKIITRNMEVYQKMCVIQKTSQCMSSERTPKNIDTNVNSNNNTSFRFFNTKRSFLYDSGLSQKSSNADISWVNLELKKTNDEFIFFQEEISAFINDKILSVNHELYDDLLSAHIKKLNAFSDKMVQIRTLLNTPECNINYNANQDETGLILNSNNILAQSFPSLTDYNRLKEIEEENKILKEQLKNFKKNQIVLNSNMYKSRKSPLEKMGSMTDDMTFSNNPTSNENHYESPNNKIIIPGINIPRNLEKISNENELLNDKEEVYNTKTSLDAKLSKKYHQNKRINRDSNDHDQKLSHTPQDHKKLTNLPDQLDKKVLKDLKNSTKTIDRLLDIISDYATGAYETIKLIASDKKKEAVSIIKDIMLEIQDYIKNFKQEQNKLLKNQQDEKVIMMLFRNFDLAVIKLLDYHDKLKKLKSDYYKHDEMKKETNDGGYVNMHNNGKSHHPQHPSQKINPNERPS